MSEHVRHLLTLLHAPTLEATPHAHAVGEKLADVADIDCVHCGLKLSIYYRVIPTDEELNAIQEEGDEE